MQSLPGVTRDSMTAAACKSKLGGKVLICHMKCSITTVASWSKCIPHLSPRQRQAGHEYFCNGHCMICKEESVPKARARGDHQVAAAGCGMALQPLKAYGRQIARPGERGLIPGGDLPMLVQGWTPKARGMRRPGLPTAGLRSSPGMRALTKKKWILFPATLVIANHVLPPPCGRPEPYQK